MQASKGDVKLRGKRAAEKSKGDVKLRGKRAAEKSLTSGSNVLPRARALYAHKEKELELITVHVTHSASFTLSVGSWQPTSGQPAAYRVGRWQPTSGQ